jgi:putative ABC transport system substrate-binding protein
VKRREVIAILGGAVVVWPLGAYAQQSKASRIGYLAQSPRSTDDVFRHAIRELGYVEGQNLTVLYRWGKDADYGSLAKELVEANVDLIVAIASPATRAAKEATTTIPIVFSQVGDPVAYGFIASLARPGGNLTGMSSQLSENAPKGVQFIKEIVSRAGQLAILGDPSNPGSDATVKSIEAAALTLGFKPKFYDLGKSAELNTAFAAILREQPVASFVIPDPFLYTRRARIIDFALTNRIPTIYGLKEYARDGGLMAVGPNRDDMARRAAEVVDKILKGAKPADVPVEQPTKFELVINLKTAKALGLTVPPVLLARADEVIE